MVRDVTPAKTLGLWNYTFVLIGHQQHKELWQEEGSPCHPTNQRASFAWILAPWKVCLWTEIFSTLEILFLKFFVLKNSFRWRFCWKAWTPRTTPSKSILSSMYSFCCSLRLDFSRYISSVAMFVNTYLLAKSQDRNSLLSLLACCGLLSSAICILSPFYCMPFWSKQQHLSVDFSISIILLWTFWIASHRKLLKNHAPKTKVLSQRAQRHSIHCSVSLETNEYKLSFKNHFTFDRVYDWKNQNCERFEPRSHFKSRLSLIVLVNVVLNRTVFVDSDWRFDNLRGSYLQSQSELYHVSWWYYIPD